MTRFRSVRLGLAVALAAGLAALLRDVIQQAVILPFAYAWWLLGLLYHAVPQVFYWSLLSAVVFLLLLDSLLPRGHVISRRRAESKSVLGPIESLSDWMRRAPRGIYYKWLIASRLGKIARELSAQRDGLAPIRVFEPLGARGSSPPEEIAAYLDSGLRGSFADYPPPRWPWSPRVVTPLDLGPEDAIRFLESQVAEVR